MSQTRQETPHNDPRGQERDAQVRRAAHALQRLQAAGLTAMAAGHAERQEEESLAAAACRPGPAGTYRSIEAAGCQPTYLPRMHVRTALVRAGLLLVPDTKTPCMTA